MRYIFFFINILCISSMCYSLVCGTDLCLFQIDFDTAMGPNPINFELLSPQGKEHYEFFKDLYKRNNITILEPSLQPRIPKIIHQIWLGSAVPEEYKVWMQSWKKFHPSWMYCLWTDTEVKRLNLYNQQLFDYAPNYGQKSDILRYELLYRFGGLYVDIDFRCLKSFDIFHHYYDFYVGALNSGTVEIGIGLIGATAQHPILKHVIASMRTNAQKNNGSIFDMILHLTGNYHFLRCFLSVAPHIIDRTIVFPCMFFYPSPNTDRHLQPEKQDESIWQESYAIHYWACSWQKSSAFVAK